MCSLALFGSLISDLPVPTASAPAPEPVSVSLPHPGGKRQWGNNLRRIYSDDGDDADDDATMMSHRTGLAA